MDIKDLRDNIDRIDAELTKLFQERMETATKIAEYKQKNNLPVFNRERERDVINKVTSSVPHELEGYTKTFYETLFNLSRSYQKKLIKPRSPVSKMIEEVTKNTPCEQPDRAMVACQGVEGAYSQLACDKMFDYPTIFYCRGFEDVFRAVDSGFCRYGILPVENSTAGTVNKVYDLMEKYKFYITRSLKLFIRHSILAPDGVQLGDIKEIFSHEQAINQCSEFINSLGVKVTICENTAVAAKMVAESGRKDCASIGSKDGAALYGLNILKTGIQNTDNNYTRFICISRNLEIYPDARKISITCNVPHEPGSLNAIISRLALAGVNLTKLESRPIPGREFEFRFFFDFEADLHDPAIIGLIAELEQRTEHFVFLGAYAEK